MVWDVEAIVLLELIPILHVPFLRTLKVYSPCPLRPAFAFPVSQSRTHAPSPCRVALLQGTPAQCPSPPRPPLAAPRSTTTTTRAACPTASSTRPNPSPPTASTTSSSRTVARSGRRTSRLSSSKVSAPPSPALPALTVRPRPRSQGVLGVAMGHLLSRAQSLAQPVSRRAPQEGRHRPLKETGCQPHTGPPQYVEG